MNRIKKRFTITHPCSSWCIAVSDIYAPRPRGPGGISAGSPKPSRSAEPSGAVHTHGRGSAAAKPLAEVLWVPKTHRNRTRQLSVRVITRLAAHHDDATHPPLGLP